MTNTRESFRDNSRWSLGGMTALVTGGSKGLGEAVVEELVMLGARVHTCGRNEAQLQERLHEWQAKGFPVTTSVCDVSSPDQRAKLMETVSSLFQGKLNILVNNAGTIYSKAYHRIFIRRLLISDGYESGVSFSSLTTRPSIVESLGLREHCGHVLRCWGCAYERRIHLWSN
ncbi:unnamed protein product [Brassica rapa subsp. narinosa]